MNAQQELDFYFGTADTAEQRFREKVRATSQAIAVYDLMKDGVPRTSMEVPGRLGMNLNMQDAPPTNLP